MVLESKTTKIPLNELIFAFLFFTALTALLRYQTFPYFFTHYIGGATHDAGLYRWLFTEALNGLNPNEWFNTNSFYPYEKTLAWSDNFILPATIGFFLPFEKITSYNLLLLIALCLNGLCTFRAAKVLGAEFFTAIAAGSLFLSYSFIHGHAGHPQLQFAFWIPLSFEWAIRFIEDKKPRTGVFLGLIIGLSFLTTVYYAIFAGILVASLLLLSRRISLYPVLGLIPFIPFIIPYLQVKDSFGGRKIYEAFYFSADAFSWIAAPSFNVLYGGFSRFSHNEAQLFPGFCALLLFLFVIKKTPLFLLPIIFSLLKIPILTAFSLWLLIGYLFYRKESLLLIFTIFWAISFGPLGNPEKGTLPLGPHAVFYYLLPGFDAVRAVGRAGVVCIFLGSLLLTKIIKNRALAVIVTVIFVVENYTSPIPLEAATPAPAIVNEIPRNGSAVIFLPMTDSLDKHGRVQSWSNFALNNVDAMNWASENGFKVVNGYSGMRSELMFNLPRWTKNFPDDVSMRALKRIEGLRYVVFRDLQTGRYQLYTLY